MKKIVLLFFAVFVLCFVARGENTGKFPVVEKKIGAFHFAYYEFKGPYEKAFEKFGEFMAALSKKGIETGPYSVGIYLDNPGITPPGDLRSEIGIMINREAEPTSDFKYRKIEGFHAISTRYGSMDEIQGAWDALGKYMTNKNLIPAGPGYEFYKLGKDPSVISAECCMPVIIE